MTPEKKAARCSRFKNAEVEWTSGFMEETTYIEHYRKRFFGPTQAVIDQAEKLLRVIFCPSCHTQESSSCITVSKMIVLLEEDPLRNYRHLVHCLCHNCGYEEYHASDEIMS